MCGDQANKGVSRDGECIGLIEIYWIQLFREALWFVIVFLWLTNQCISRTAKNLYCIVCTRNRNIGIVFSKLLSSTTFKSLLEEHKLFTLSCDNQEPCWPFQPSSELTLGLVRGEESAWQIATSLCIAIRLHTATSVSVLCSICAFRSFFTNKKRTG